MRPVEFDPRIPTSGQTHGMRSVTTRRVDGAEGAGAEALCQVIEESPLFLEVREVGVYTLMWTRTDPPQAAGFVAGDGVLGDSAEPDALALAAGFLLTEGMIHDLDEVAHMALCAESPDVVRIVLAPHARKAVRRGPGLVASACGLCGDGDAWREGGASLPAVGRTLAMPAAWLEAGMNRMKGWQRLFALTGGAHAAALFAQDGSLLSAAEDLGRHNALDKAIGRCLLRNRPTAGGWALLSGRVSVEMVAKAARAGIELLGAVSAPSSLAIETADRAGLTLCGFVREGRATAFTHPERLLAEAPL